jgi:hypothetical protein
MSNVELITTIITSVLTIVGAVLGVLATKSEKAKKFYKTYIEVEKKVKELCIVAESSYKDGDKKKKYVISSITTYLKQNDIEFDLESIDGMIESVISISKKIN